jgi:hypothetical protein
MGVNGSPFEPHESLYDSGRAFGTSDIKSDTMTFRYREEMFVFPTLRVYGVARFNGYFYEADIEDLRKLAEAGTA